MSNILNKLTEEYITDGNFEDFYSFVAQNASKNKMKFKKNKLLIKR